VTLVPVDDYLPGVALHVAAMVPSLYYNLLPGRAALRLWVSRTRLNALDHTGLPFYHHLLLADVTYLPLHLCTQHVYSRHLTVVTTDLPVTPALLELDGHYRTAHTDWVDAIALDFMDGSTCLRHHMPTHYRFHRQVTVGWTHTLRSARHNLLLH